MLPPQQIKFFITVVGEANSEPLFVLTSLIAPNSLRPTQVLPELPGNFLDRSLALRLSLLFYYHVNPHLLLIRAIAKELTSGEIHRYSPTIDWIE